MKKKKLQPRNQNTNKKNTDSYHYCPVPHSGQDAILFVGLAIVAACVLRGKLGTTMLLLAGAALEALTVIPGWTLGRIGNSISWFLSIVPYELFFYIFLPPLLLDAGARIDYFLFKRALLQILTAAFLVVGFTTAAMIPLLLYVLRLADRGWGWQHVALLGSMLASTDAVAIINVMKERGGPRRLRVLLEGESLLNDASSFTLFSIFLGYVLGTHGGAAAGQHGGAAGKSGGSGAPVGWSVLGAVVADMLKLALGGLLFGVAFGVLAHALLKFMRRHRAGIDQQVALTLAGGYLSFYTANSFHLSGVVAVAVFGLYGASTSTWDLPPASHGAFEAFWDSLSFVANSIVFFFTGVAIVNFFVRSGALMSDAAVSTESNAPLLGYSGGGGDAAAQAQAAAARAASASPEAKHRAVVMMWDGLWRFPLVYLIVFALRFLLLTAFRPLFRLEGSDLPVRDAFFATVAGLRGSVALILAQAVITAGDASTIQDGERVPARVSPSEIRVRAEIVLWTALFVLCTLLINAPLLPKVLRVTRLDVVPDARLALRRRALRALDAHTASAVAGLRAEEDAMMAGVDWTRVRELTKVGGAKDFASFAEQAGGGGGGAKNDDDDDKNKKKKKNAGRVAVTDAWESLGGVFKRSWAAVSGLFSRGGSGGSVVGGSRRGRVISGGGSVSGSFAAADSRRQKSASSMANIFLDETGSVARHHRVFGRTISLGPAASQLSIDTSTAAAAGGGGSGAARRRSAGWRAPGAVPRSAPCPPGCPTGTACRGRSRCQRWRWPATSACCCCCRRMETPCWQRTVTPGCCLPGAPTQPARRANRLPPARRRALCLLPCCWPCCPGRHPPSWGWQAPRRPAAGRVGAAATRRRRPAPPPPPRSPPQSRQWRLLTGLLRHFCLAAGLQGGGRMAGGSNWGQPQVTEPDPRTQPDPSLLQPGRPSIGTHSQVTAVGLRMTHSGLASSLKMPISVVSLSAPPARGGGAQGGGMAWRVGQGPRRDCHRRCPALGAVFPSVHSSTLLPGFRVNATHAGSSLQCCPSSSTVPGSTHSCISGLRQAQEAGKQACGGGGAQGLQRCSFLPPLRPALQLGPGRGAPFAPGTVVAAVSV